MIQPAAKFALLSGFFTLKTCVMRKSIMNYARFTAKM
jgi:hypothetical protein